VDGSAPGDRVSARGNQDGAPTTFYGTVRTSPDHRSRTRTTLTTAAARLLCSWTCHTNAQVITLTKARVTVAFDDGDITTLSSSALTK
jgi:hypothetical protein